MKFVKDYIFKDLTCLNENSTIRKVIKTMRLHRLSAMPVVNPLGEYAGCITEQDILDAAVPAYMKSIYDTSFMAGLDQITSQLQAIIDKKAIDYIDRNYPTVSPNDSMSYAADLLYRANGTVLPVVEEKSVVGLITSIEILSVSLDENK